MSDQKDGRYAGKVAFVTGASSGIGRATALAFARDGASVVIADRLRRQNVRVNAVSPGSFETPMMDRFSGGTPEGRERVIAQEPLGRMGKPDEIASAVLWLCSEGAGFMVGHAMVIDGGQTIGL